MDQLVNRDQSKKTGDHRDRQIDSDSLDWSEVPPERDKQEGDEKADWSRREEQEPWLGLAQRFPWRCARVKVRIFRNRTNVESHVGVQNAHANGRRYAVPFSGLFGIVCYRIPSFCRTFSTMVYACLLMIFFPWATHAKA